jgi:hypothetical protein
MKVYRSRWQRAPNWGEFGIIMATGLGIAAIVGTILGLFQPWDVWNGPHLTSSRRASRPTLLRQGTRQRYRSALTQDHVRGAPTDCPPVHRDGGVVRTYAGPTDGRLNRTPDAPQGAPRGN